MIQEDIVRIAEAYPINEIVKRYASEQNVSLEIAEEHAREIKRFLTLCALSPEKSYAMRGPTDEFWHTFVTFTARYTDFCERVAGKFIHHFPNTEPRARERYTFNRGRKGGPKKEVSRADLKQCYLDMLNDYEGVFGLPAPQHLWPRPSANEAADGTLGCSPCRCGCRCLA